MSKLLLSLSILSLLAIGGLLQFNKTNSTLRQSSDIYDGLNVQDQALLNVSFDNRTTPSKGEWLKCYNSREIQPCEKEESFIVAKQEFDLAVSKQSRCILFNQTLQTSNDGGAINKSYLRQCYYDLYIRQIAAKNSCISSYHTYFLNCGKI